jgi:hypothetical protein
VLKKYLDFFKILTGGYYERRERKDFRTEIRKYVLGTH